MLAILEKIIIALLVLLYYRFVCNKDHSDCFIVYFIYIQILSIHIVNINNNILLRIRISLFRQNSNIINNTLH